MGRHLGKASKDFFSPWIEQYLIKIHILLNIIIIDDVIIYVYLFL